MIVHVLRLGFPVCDFSRAVPADWPPGHSWAPEGDPAVNCIECLKRSHWSGELIKAATQIGFPPIAFRDEDKEK